MICSGEAGILWRTRSLHPGPRLRKPLRITKKI